MNKQRIFVWCKIALGVLGVAVFCICVEGYVPTLCYDFATRLFELIESYILAPILTLAKDFSWAFLVFLLFLVPSFYEKVLDLIDRLGKKAVAYGKATHPKIEPQTSEEKKDFSSEQESEIEKDMGKPSFAERYREYKRRKDVLKSRLQRQADYLVDSKLEITEDPVISSARLLFECSYCYKTEDDQQYYINTLISRNGPMLLFRDRLYKYLRIMKDINKAEKDKKYAIEVILIDEKDVSYQKSGFQLLFETYKPAVDASILHLRECKIKGEEIEIVNSHGLPHCLN